MIHMHIRPPAKIGQYTRRLLDCRDAIEPVYRASSEATDPAIIERQLVAAGRQVGWGEAEILVALSLVTRGPRQSRTRRRQNGH